MKMDKVTLGEALYLGAMNYFGYEVDDYWELSNIERTAWEHEAVRILIKDIPEKELGQAINGVQV